MMRFFLPAEVAWWLGAIVLSTGVVVCLVYVRRTWWAILPMAGFAVETMIAVFFRMATGPVDQILGMERSYALRLVSQLGLVAKTLVIIGVWGLLTEVTRRTTSTGSGRARRGG
jgi:hypothetical protein